MARGRYASTAPNQPTEKVTCVVSANLRRRGVMVIVVRSDLGISRGASEERPCQSRLPKRGRGFVYGYFFSTNFIPHLGQLPGLSCTTSGCMVQLYCVLAAAPCLWPGCSPALFSCSDLLHPVTPTA